MTVAAAPIYSISSPPTQLRQNRLSVFRGVGNLAYMVVNGKFLTVRGFQAQNSAWTVGEEIWAKRHGCNRGRLAVSGDNYTRPKHWKFGSSRNLITMTVDIIYSSIRKFKWPPFTRCAMDKNSTFLRGVGCGFPERVESTASHMDGIVARKSYVNQTKLPARYTW